MPEQKKGRTYIDFSRMRKESVQIDKEGRITEVEQPTGKPKSLDEYLEARRKRMGR